MIIILTYLRHSYRIIFINWLLKHTVLKMVHSKLYFHFKSYQIKTLYFRLTRGVNIRKISLNFDTTSNTKDKSQVQNVHFENSGLQPGLPPLEKQGHSKSSLKIIVVLLKIVGTSIKWNLHNLIEIQAAGENKLSLSSTAV
jgi:hypothetical protein